MSLEKRVERLEQAEHARLEAAWGHAYAEAAELAAEAGIPVSAVLAEAEAFFSLPVAEQLAELDRLEALFRAEGLELEDVAWLRATIRRGDR